MDGGVTGKLGRGQVRCEDNNARDALQLEGALDRKADGGELRIGCVEPACDSPVYPLGLPMLQRPSTSGLELLVGQHGT